MLEKFFKEFIKTNNLINDVKNLFIKFDKINILEHSERVCNKAVHLAEKFYVDKDKAIVSSYLHDISGIIKNEDRIIVAESLNLEILDEEREFPLIIHQKLSKIIAKDIFCINDVDILQAISCHTTLHKNPSKLDMILFISDKIEWDQKDKPPYLKIIEENLHISLEKGVSAFVKYLMSENGNLRIIHPWLKDANDYFNEMEYETVLTQNYENDIYNLSR